MAVMHYYEVAPNRIIRANSDFFTYSSLVPLLIGQIVLVEVGKKKIIGVVLREANQPSYQTKPILSLIEPNPLPVELVDLALWLSKYYVTPLATVWQTILPSGLQKVRRQKSKQPITVKRDRTNIVFNKDQLTSLETIDKYDSGTFLLQGITGSGKTEIYIHVIKQAIAAGKSAIVLVPEIALTSQLVAELSNHFSNLLVTHSKMTEAERHLAWADSLNNSQPLVVVGPRSAIFSPIRNIGAIIVDEAHEPSFKQEQAPKYSALRAATMLGRYHKAKVIFGSATPSVIDRYLAEQSDRPILTLTKSARVGSLPANIKLVDMTKRDNFKKHRFLSDQLLEQIDKTLQPGKQVLIFHNRRGSTSTTMCEECGWFAQCPRCFLPLTLHADNHNLRCHICDYKTDVPTSCPICKSTNIIHKGFGTKIIEAELKKLFPNANIARFDADNKNDEAVNARYHDLYNGVIDIAIGTQVVAKGLDLPHLRTVGVIQADAGLALPDFNSNERNFQLLSQVVGRVGRNEHQTQVIVQTYQPTHPSITNGLKQDYESFYKQTLAERQRALFPPFTHLLKLTCVYKTETAAIKNAQLLANELKNKINKNTKILGPTPAFYERQHDTYRWQIIIKGSKREYLIEALKLVPASHWQFELDPTSLL